MKKIVLAIAITTLLVSGLGVANAASPISSFGSSTYLNMVFAGWNISGASSVSLDVKCTGDSNLKYNRFSPASGGIPCTGYKQNFVYSSGTGTGSVRFDFPTERTKDLTVEFTLWASLNGQTYSATDTEVLEANAESSSESESGSGSESNTTTNTSTELPTCELDANKSSYEFGDEITFSWSAENANKVYFYRPSGGLNIPAGYFGTKGSGSIDADKLGTYSVTLFAANDTTNRTGTCSTTVTIEEGDEDVDDDTEVVPNLTRVSPGSGMVGLSVTLYGDNLDSATGLLFVGATNDESPVGGEYHYNNFTVDSSGNIQVLIPSQVTVDNEDGNTYYRNVLPGRYYFSADNSFGKSDILYFTVTSTNNTAAIGTPASNIEDVQRIEGLQQQIRTLLQQLIQLLTLQLQQRNG